MVPVHVCKKLCILYVCSFTQCFSALMLRVPRGCPCSCAQTWPNNDDSDFDYRLQSLLCGHLFIPWLSALASHRDNE